jgi:diguanylate cyclase (GGDEF)-like protein/PAS domain S-box-containing protein
MPAGSRAGATAASLRAAARGRDHTNPMSRLPNGPLATVPPGTDPVPETTDLRRRESILSAVAFAAERFLRGPRWEESLPEVLERLGTATAVSRVFLYAAPSEPGAAPTAVRRWEAADAPPLRAGVERGLAGNADALARWSAGLQTGALLHGRTSDQPPVIRELLAQWSVLSFAVVPIHTGEGFWGVLGLSDCARERDWSAGELEGLRTAGEVLGAAIQRAADERALRSSEERFRVLVQNVPAVVYLCRNDARYTMLYLSESVRDLTGRPAADFLADEVSFVEIYHPDDAVAIGSQVDTALAERRAFHLAYRLRHTDGGWRWIEERGQGVFEDDELRYLEGSLVDISDRKRAEAELLHNALHDGLTDLPNRALFLDRLQVAMGRARRALGEPFAVLFVDLDRFKVVNDSLGHAFGDQLLVAISQRLRDCLRPGDTIARFGGDEFALVLEDLQDPADALRVAERIQESLASPFDLGGHEVYSGASIGIALDSPAYATPEEVLRDADTAMYQAKARGRGGHVVFDPEMHARALARLALESDLRRALERQEMVLLYQPIVALGDRSVVGVEALLRWAHPARGLLAPDAFLEVAAETGVLPAIGAWVLHEACARLHAWHRQAPHLLLHVNLHPVEFTHPNLPAVVASALSLASVTPACLRLELTEHVIMQDADRAVLMLEELRRLGVSLCLDDFGTGHSSLSALHRFPISALKVDRSFVARLGEEADGAEIVRTIATLGRTMQIAAIAEGIERERQLELLRELGYRFGQGYHFAPPLTVQQVDQLLAIEGPAAF